MLVSYVMNCSVVANSAAASQLLSTKLKTVSQGKLNSRKKIFFMLVTIPIHFSGFQVIIYMNVVLHNL